MNTPQPTAEALRLAVLLSGHTHCQHELGRAMPVCDGCAGDARIIDCELQLPQRNAALLLLQGLIDEWQRRGDDNDPSHWTDGYIDDLREALARIKANP